MKKGTHFNENVFAKSISFQVRYEKDEQHCHICMMIVSNTKCASFHQKLNM